MTIYTPGAAPQGAAPASVAAGPSARPGEAPVVNDLFTSLMTQLLGGAPVGRASAARAGVPASLRAAARPRATPPPGPNGAPPPTNAASPAETPSDVPGQDETRGAPLDTTALVADAAGEPSVVVPTWLWSVSASDGQSAAEAAAPVCGDETNAPETGDTEAGIPALAGCWPVREAPSSASLGGSEPSGDIRGTDRVPRAGGRDAATWIAGGSFVVFGGVRTPPVTPAPTETRDTPPTAGTPGTAHTETAGATVRVPEDMSAVPCEVGDDGAAAEAGEPGVPVPASPASVVRSGGLTPTRRSASSGGSAVSPVTASPVHADGAAAQAAAGRPAADPDRLPAARPDQPAIDRAARVGALFGSTPLPAAQSNAPASQAQPLPVPAAVNTAASDLSSTSDDRQGSAGQSLSDRARSDEAQTAGRAAEVMTAELFHAEHAAASARPVGVVGANALQAVTPPSSAPPPTGAPIVVPDPGDLRRQIVQGIKFQWRDGIGDVKLTLHPEYLGEMSIALRVEQGGVTAQLSADSASVRAWALANEPLLRQGLAEQGLALSRLVVTDEAPEPSPDREGRRRAPQQDTPKPPAPRRSPAATFEIVL